MTPVPFLDRTRRWNGKPPDVDGRRHCPTNGTARGQSLIRAVELDLLFVRPSG